MVASHIVADRLYGIELRPQELAQFGAAVHFGVRCSAIYDVADQPQQTHYQLLVLEIWTDVPADDPSGRPAGRLDLVKCGWELELATEEAVPAGQLPPTGREIRFLLGRVAETINELARRAELEAPLGPELLDELADAAVRSAAHGSS